MRKLFTFVAVGLLVTAAFAQDKVKIAVAAPKVGDKVAHKLLIKFDVQGNDVEITGTRVCKVTKVEEGKTTSLIDMSDIKVLVGGSEQGITTSEGELVAKPDGNIQSVSGGLEGSDPYRMIAVAQFLAPTVEVAPGDKYTIEFDEVKTSEVPKRKIEGTYVGKEDYKGKSALKFTVKYSEPGVTGGMSFETTYWVDETGKVLKLDGKIKSMFVPAISSYIDGTIVAEIAG